MNSFRILFYLIAYVITRTHANNATEKAQDKSICELKCSEEPTEYVCGDDNLNYRNQCELRQASLCDGKNVKKLHRGKCFDAESAELAFEQNCLEQRRKSQETSKETGIPVFVPVCKDDGSFVEVQCFYGTGYCWCVNQEGKPVPGTSIQYERPKCRTKVKRKRSRRGKKPRRNNSKKGSKGSSKSQNGGGKKGRKHACIQADRSEFNTQVVNLIITDYRTRHGRVPDGTMDHRREMIEWKFAQMDLDHNGIIKRREFREFRRTVKRLARNKVCARHFWQYCDMKSDGRVDKSEWTSCLGLDTNIPFTAFMSLHSEPNQNDRKKHQQRNTTKLPTPSTLFQWREQKQKELLSDSPIKRVGAASASASSGLGGGGQDQDCRIARKQAIDENARSGVRDAFIPECDGGDFRQVQCYQSDSQSFCWCVDHKAGTTITGTTVKGGRPNCDASMRSINLASTSLREWKKCSSQQRDDFKTQLMHYLRHVMLQETEVNRQTRYRLPQSTSVSVGEEQVAKWHFNQLDQNHNGELSRKELRPLRQKLSSIRKMKRCGKRIQLHCDPDGNASITQQEWLACVLKHSDNTSQRQLPVITKNPRGPNPLEKWLKAD